MERPIALCCIQPKAKSVYISEKDIEGVFKEEAQITRILIFQREPIFKCFIEFSDKLSFEKALRNIEKVPFTFGKVCLYHSKKELLTNAYKCETIENLGKVALELKNSNTHNMQDSLYKNTIFKLGGKTPLIYNDSFLLSKNEVLDKDFFDPFEFPFLTFKDPLSEVKNDDNCRVLLIKTGDFCWSRLTLIQNALGCFGNLQRLLINKPRRRILAEMETSKQANMVYVYLNKMNFFGTALQVSYTSIIQLKSQIEENGTFVEFVQIGKISHRFKNHLRVKFNPPSTILHFTSISSNIDCLILYELIAKSMNQVKSTS